MILHPPEVPMEEPGMCFLCESSPNQATVKVVSMNRTFDPGELRTYLNGMKYLCEECVRGALVVFGWAQPEVADGYKETAEHLADERQELLNRISTFETLDSQLKSLYGGSDEPEAADETPAPKAKRAPKKAAPAPENSFHAAVDAINAGSE